MKDTDVYQNRILSADCYMFSLLPLKCLDKVDILKIRNWFSHQEMIQ